MKKLDRRVFLKSGGLALVSLGAVPSFMVRAARAATDPPSAGHPRILVCIFQRGAVDGLNVVIPWKESAYYAGRPNIAIPPPRKGTSGTVLDLDGFFGLHPAMAPLLPAWTEGQLGIVHAAGSPHATRSHFDAQDFMETAVPGRKGVSDGWLNRVLSETGAKGKTGTFRGMAIASSNPRSLSGPVPTLTVSDLGRFGVRERPERGRESMGDAFSQLYGATEDELLGGAGRESLAAARTLRSLRPDRYRAANGAEYPPGRLGNSLRQIAQLIKAEIGLEIAFAESGGWDHHANEGNETGTLARLLAVFSSALAAFQRDLGETMERVLVLTMSEFGRTVRENGTRGTDHGHANVMLAMGGGVAGKRVHGDWPGLAREQLYEGRDLAVTTDFRNVFAEVAREHLGARRLKAIFPGFAPSPGDFPGILR